MTPILLASAAAAGVYLIFTAAVDGRRDLRSRVRLSVRAGDRPGLRSRLGVTDVAIRDVTAGSIALAVVGGAVAFALFGGLLPSLVAAALASTFPVVTLRSRLTARRRAAMSSWPRMLEELRVLTGSVGSSIPQALITVGRRAPLELRDAFAAAEREWFLSTDFERALAVLKHGLQDPTADAACETLLVAHEVGGVDLDRRLASLIEDRILDTQGRKDAEARQAGARFARRFVLVVPFGMALAGMSVGTGRAAYASGFGQVLVAVALGLVAACWVWAGHIMSVPEEQRVFGD